VPDDVHAPGAAALQPRQQVGLVDGVVVDPDLVAPRHPAVRGVGEVDVVLVGPAGVDGAVIAHLDHVEQVAVIGGVVDGVVLPGHAVVGGAGDVEHPGADVRDVDPMVGVVHVDVAGGRPRGVHQAHDRIGEPVVVRALAEEPGGGNRSAIHEVD